MLMNLRIDAILQIFGEVRHHAKYFFAPNMRYGTIIDLFE